MQNMENADTRPLPEGWTQHYEPSKGVWYYVHLASSPPQVSFAHPADMLQNNLPSAPKVARELPQPYANAPPPGTPPPPPMPVPNVSASRSLPMRPPAHPSQSQKSFAQQLYASSHSKTLGPMLSKPEIRNSTPAVSTPPQNRQSARLSLLPMAPPLAPAKNSNQFTVSPPPGQLHGQVPFNNVATNGVNMDHHLPHRTQSLQMGAQQSATSHVHHPGRTSTYFDGQFVQAANASNAPRPTPQLTTITRPPGETIETAQPQPGTQLIPQSSVNGSPPGYQDPYYSNPMPSPEPSVPSSGTPVSNASLSPPPSSALFSQSPSPAPSSATTSNSGTLSPLWSPASGNLNVTPPSMSSVPAFAAPTGVAGNAVPANTINSGRPPASSSAVASALGSATVNANNFVQSAIPHSGVSGAIPGPSASASAVASALGSATVSANNFVNSATPHSGLSGAMGSIPGPSALNGLPNHVYANNNNMVNPGKPPGAASGPAFQANVGNCNMVNPGKPPGAVSAPAFQANIGNSTVPSGASANAPSAAPGKPFAALQTGGRIAAQAALKMASAAIDVTSKVKGYITDPRLVNMLKTSFGKNNTNGVTEADLQAVIQGKPNANYAAVLHALQQQQKLQEQLLAAQMQAQQNGVNYQRPPQKIDYSALIAEIQRLQQLSLQGNGGQAQQQQHHHMGAQSHAPGRPPRPHQGHHVSHQSHGGHAGQGHHQGGHPGQAHHHQQPSHHQANHAQQAHPQTAVQPGSQQTWHPQGASHAQQQQHQQPAQAPQQAAHGTGSSLPHWNLPPVQRPPLQHAQSAPAAHHANQQQQHSSQPSHHQSHPSQSNSGSHQQTSHAQSPPRPPVQHQHTGSQQQSWNAPPAQGVQNGNQQSPPGPTTQNSVVSGQQAWNSQSPPRPPQQQQQQQQHQQNPSVSGPGNWNLPSHLRPPNQNNQPQNASPPGSQHQQSTSPPPNQAHSPPAASSQQQPWNGNSGGQVPYSPGQQVPYSSNEQQQPQQGQNQQQAWSPNAPGHQADSYASMMHAIEQQKQEAMANIQQAVAQSIAAQQQQLNSNPPANGIQAAIQQQAIANQQSFLQTLSGQPPSQQDQQQQQQQQQQFLAALQQQAQTQQQATAQQIASIQQNQQQQTTAQQQAFAQQLAQQHQQNAAQQQAMYQQIAQQQQQQAAQQNAMTQQLLQQQQAQQQAYMQQNQNNEPSTLATVISTMGDIYMQQQQQQSYNYTTAPSEPSMTALLLESFNSGGTTATGTDPTGYTVDSLTMSMNSTSLSDPTYGCEDPGVSSGLMDTISQTFADGGALSGLTGGDATAAGSSFMDSITQSLSGATSSVPSFDFSSITSSVDTAGIVSGLADASSLTSTVTALFGG